MAGAGGRGAGRLLLLGNFILALTVAKTERSPQARRTAAAKRTRSGETVHDFWGMLTQLGTLTMNRIEPSGPGKPGFDVPASPTPTQDQAQRLLNANVPMR